MHSNTLQPELLTDPYSYNHFPPSLQPQERLRFAGPAALSTPELLSIILGDGKSPRGLRLAESLLAQTGGLRNLAHLNHTELTQFPGIGPAKAASIHACIELVRRFHAASPTDKFQVTKAHDLANQIMMEMSLLDHEQFRVVCLDTQNYFHSMHTLYTGNVNMIIIRVAEVFRPTIRTNCPQWIAVHNHPSGDPTPSPEDVRITQMLYTASQQLDLNMLDHIIIGHNRFVSLKERGLGFQP